MKTTALSVLLFVGSVFSTRCPDPLSIQDPELATKFNMMQFVGAEPYYEIAYHDYTQPQMCGCMISRKSISETGTYIDDNGSILCPWRPEDPTYGKIYDQHLTFNVTENPGILSGYWAVTKDVDYPDTIVAVGWPDVEGEPYRWALEMQCVEQFH
mgnify:CR=1 FL=1